MLRSLRQGASHILPDNANYVDDEDANQVDVWWYDDCNDISGEEEGSKQAACHKLQISQGVRGQTVAGMYLKHVKLEQV